MSRAHSFPRPAEFQAEPRNSSNIAAKNGGPYKSVVEP